MIKGWKKTYSTILIVFAGSFVLAMALTAIPHGHNDKAEESSCSLCTLAAQGHGLVAEHCGCFFSSLIPSEWLEFCLPSFFYPTFTPSEFQSRAPPAVFA